MVGHGCLIRHGELLLRNVFEQLTQLGAPLGLSLPRSLNILFDLRRLEGYDLTYGIR